MLVVGCYTFALKVPSNVKANLPSVALFVAPHTAGEKAGSRCLNRVASSLSQHPFGSHYNRLLSSFPYPTKMISSGIVGGFGDILVQTLSCLRRKEPIFIDLKRLRVFTSVATFYIAPTIHLWFEFLERLKIPKSLGEGKTMKSVVMILADQTVGATLISAGFFFAFELVRLHQLNFSYSSSLTFAQAQFFILRTPRNTLFEALLAGYEMNKRHLWRTLVVNWYYWPIINFLNFRNVPLQYR